MLDADQHVSLALNAQMKAQLVRFNEEICQPDVANCKQVYDDAFLAEWILISIYSSDDFGNRFIWPEVEPEANLHYFSNTVSYAA
jgi:hypothetical protein